MPVRVQVPPSVLISENPDSNESGFFVLNTRQARLSAWEKQKTHCAFAQGFSFSNRLGGTHERSE